MQHILMRDFRLSVLTIKSTFCCPHARAQTKLVRDGVVVALMKLINVESVPAHRLVSGCLANLTTTRDMTWELIQAKGHQVNFNACRGHACDIS